MASRDMLNLVSILTALAPAATSAADRTGVIIDTRDFDSVTFALQFTDSDEAGTAYIKLQHGDDSGLSDAADVPERDILPQAADIPDYVNNPVGTVELPAGAAGIAKIGYVGSKRYVRIFLESDGTDQISSAMVILGHAHRTPVA